MIAFYLPWFYSQVVFQNVFVKRENGAANLPSAAALLYLMPSWPLSGSFPKELNPPPSVIQCSLPGGSDQRTGLSFAKCCQELCEGLCILRKCYSKVTLFFMVMSLLLPAFSICLHRQAWLVWDLLMPKTACQMLPLNDVLAFAPPTLQCSSSVLSANNSSSSRSLVVLHLMTCNQIYLMILILNIWKLYLEGYVFSKLDLWKSYYTVQVITCYCTDQVMTAWSKLGTRIEKGFGWFPPRREQIKAVSASG